MLSINAVKGFEYGEGFAGATQRGSQQNDMFLPPAAAGAPLATATNHSGGIQGGIANGQDISMRIAFKPVATLLREQQTVDISGHPATFTARGRHDPCVLPRAVPVVEAMAAMTRQAETADMIKYGVIVVATAPMLILYPWLQKYFAKGVMIGSVKG